MTMTVPVCAPLVLIYTPLKTGLRTVASGLFRQGTCTARALNLHRGDVNS